MTSDLIDVSSSAVIVMSPARACTVSPPEIQASTAVATLFTFCPPGPCAVVTSSFTSAAQSIFTSTSSGSGRTSTC